MDFCDFRLISVQFTCWISVTGGGVISSFLWLLPFWCERATVSCDVTLLLTQLQPVWQQCDQCDTLCDTLCDNLAVLCRHDIVQLQTNYCRTQFDNSAPPFCTIVSAVLYQTHCIWGICLILLGNVEKPQESLLFRLSFERKRWKLLYILDQQWGILRELKTTLFIAPPVNKHSMNMVQGALNSWIGAKVFIWNC